MSRFLPILFACFVFFSNAQELKSPSDFHGYKLGTQFTRHHEVVDYFNYLAKARPTQVKLLTYGQTYERRPLHLAFVSSADNLKNLDAIRKSHLEATKGGSAGTKAIVWLSYNVHGNESVGTEAAMETLYTLLTAKSGYLEDTVVIIDPCVNPDGRDRYVNWYNQHKNTPRQTDPNSKEHHEGWWTGRSNHYMFDLNRDWAWLSQVESQQRMVHYNKWLPHIHVDFHEQGINNPYYFAPAAEPYHEVVTPFQRSFQKTIGKNHAKYFDANGWLYFTKEVFDLFYPSYGDTYPTYNGAVGMTYEQGGSGRAGLAVETRIGDTLTLQDRIAHHLTTGLSTIEVAANKVTELNTAFKAFFSKTDFTYKSYVLSGNKDNIATLKELLDKHDIQYGTPKTKTVKGYRYDSNSFGTQTVAENAMVVSTNQPKGTMVKVLFEPTAKLSDSLTYDITAWSLPYAYGLNAVASSTIITPEREVVESQPLKKLEDAYGFVTDWNSIKDARFLAALLKEKIRVRGAYAPFTIEGTTYQSGSLIITKSDNQQKLDFLKKLNQLAQGHGKKMTPVATGFVDTGKDFGSSYIQTVKQPKVAILSGKPVSTLRFGEIWHFFEQELGYPVTVIDTDYADTIAMERYDILILPDGTYGTYLNQTRLKRLKEWVSKGGKLVAMGSAISGIKGKNGFGIKAKKISKDSVAIPKPHKNRQREFVKNAITGAVFKAKVDNSHPLAFGYGDTYYTLKLGDIAFDYLKNGNAVYLEGQQKPVSGFAGSKAQEKQEDTLIFGAEAHGNGQVVYLVDNPLFRGFWENGKLLFANAIFMTN